MKLHARLATEADADAIVDLFSEGGNQHNWSYEKWCHYYLNYTEGKTYSLIVEANGKLLGHYGLFPIRIGQWRVYLGAHAYVSEPVRGLAVISNLMKFLDDFCNSRNVPFIIGFANPRFTKVKNTLFRWKTPIYASFVKANELNVSRYQNRPFLFKYTDGWKAWRFGVSAKTIISRYNKNDGECVNQLLYAESDISAESVGVAEFECWDPVGYLTEPSEAFTQPISIKIYDSEWQGPDLLDPDNWFIQMGDSDSFVYKAI